MCQSHDVFSPSQISDIRPRPVCRTAHTEFEFDLERGAKGRRTREGHLMAEMKRRDFLKGGSMAVAAAGVVAAMPVLPALVNAVDTEGPEVDADAASTSEAALNMAQPLVVRITDLTSGSMQMFFGTQEVNYTDPQLAARLFRASQ
jgi:TAT (twin-arginine translocation) pathway signal sequence